MTSAALETVANSSDWRPDPDAHNGCSGCPARALSVCGAIPANDAGCVSAVVSHRRASAGDALLNEGDRADSVLNIIDGTVKVYKLLPDGRRQITGFLHPGDLLGLAHDDSYTASAEALTPVRYCVYPRRQFERLLDGSRPMEKFLLARVSNELIAAQEQMVMLGRKTAQEKIASFLVMLLDRARRNNRQSDRMVVPMTRADIADYLGLTTETVSRGFTRLKDRGMIELCTGGKVRIPDLEALRLLASGAEN